jgi:hypothetical protein
MMLPHDHGRARSPDRYFVDLRRQFRFKNLRRRPEDTNWPFSSIAPARRGEKRCAMPSLIFTANGPFRTSKSIDAPRRPCMLRQVAKTLTFKYSGASLRISPIPTPR